MARPAAQLMAMVAHVAVLTVVAAAGSWEQPVLALGIGASSLVSPLCAATDA